jgi:hypothetical protein
VERDGEIHFSFSGGCACRSRLIARESPRVVAIDPLGGPARFELASDGRGGTDQ